jgi:hypothetical protein
VIPVPDFKLTDAEVAEGLEHLRRFSTACLEGGNGLREIRPIWSDETQTRGLGAWVTPEKLLEGVPVFRQWNEEGASVYLSINFRRDHGCRKGADSIPADLIVADFDDGRSLEEILAAIKAAGLPAPTAIVQTTAGKNKYHVYWRLTETIPDLATFERLQEGLVNALGSDAVTVSAQQVMRLPGPFVNPKPGRGYARVLLVEAHGDRRYKIDLFPLAPEAPVYDPVPLDQLAVKIESGSMGDHSRRLVEELELFPGNLGRRESIFAAARDLHGREWPLADALAVLIATGEKLGLEAFDLEDLDRQIRRAFATPATPGKAAAESFEIDFGASAPVAADEELEAMTLPELPAWPNRPDVALRHGILADVIGELEEQTEADAVALALQFLVGFGSVVGRRPHALVGATRHGTNLFCAVVGETGKARKGTGLDLIRHLLGFADPVWSRECITTNISSGEGLIYAIRDPVEKVVVDKKTGQASPVIVDEGVADKRLLVSCTEMAALLRAAKNERSTLMPRLREAWDGLGLANKNKNSPDRATDPHVSLIAHITREELTRLATEGDVYGGSYNRICFSLSRRVRFLPEGGDVSAAPRLGDLIRDCVDRARHVGLITRTGEARECWAHHYRNLTTVPEGGIFGAILGRGEAQTLRLSLIMALLAKRSSVDVADLEAALDLWHYCRDSARVIFAPAGGLGTADLGGQIVAAVTAARPGGLSRSELVERLHIRKDRRGEFMLELARAKARGLIVAEVVPTAGRPREEWRAAPTLIRNPEKPFPESLPEKVETQKPTSRPRKKKDSAPTVPFSGFPEGGEALGGKPALDLSAPLAPGRYEF